ncbi:flagellar basal body-associated FliL family protein [Eionea flava]
MLSVLLLVLSLFFVMPAWSADDDAAEDATDESTEGTPGVLVRPIYVPVKPAFVVNYGGEGKLQYMKVEISLRVADVSAANAVRHHMPLVRDSLVTLFSRQTNENIDMPDGRERLRLDALKIVQQVVEEEDGEQGVINLYFSHFVVQK